MTTEETTTIEVSKQTHADLRAKESYPKEPFDSIIRRHLKIGGA